jgi:hypothetical protein
MAPPADIESNTCNGVIATVTVALDVPVVLVDTLDALVEKPVIGCLAA